MKKNVFKKLMCAVLASCMLLPLLLYLQWLMMAGYTQKLLQKSHFCIQVHHIDGYDKKGYPASYSKSVIYK
ncbi:MAG: hypothetical protein ACLTDV_01655 [Eubacterium sp.]